MAWKRKSSGILKAVHAFSSGKTRFSIALLCIVSFVCALSNVLLPILQKVLLEDLDHTGDHYLWALLGIGSAGCVFLGLESLINISIMMSFRQELERALMNSLLYKDQEMIREKGVGAFSAAIIGDSEQIARVLAASWFSIFFNLAGALASIIISATWKIYFFVIVLSAYALILIIVFVFNQISVAYFRKEKEVGYLIARNMREYVDTSRSVFAYGSPADYQDRLRECFDLRRKYLRGYEMASAVSSALIKLVKVIALVAFFFFAVNELRSANGPWERDALYPTIVALVSYFETIFVPISALSTTYNNALKFRAFYEPYEEAVRFKGLGQVPEDHELKISDISLILDSSLVLSDVSIDVDKVYGVVGLDGLARARLLSYVFGDADPKEGSVTLGGVPMSEVEKYLRLSLVTWNSKAHDVYEHGLEYNLTLGKKILKDRAYEQGLKEYMGEMLHFFQLLGEGKVTTSKYRPLLRKMVREIFGLSGRHYLKKSFLEEEIRVLKEVKDPKEFIHVCAPSLYAKKYVRKSRYDKIVGDLRLLELDRRDFGVSGRKLTEADRALILLARFLLPDTDNPFVLIDPLEHLPIDLYDDAIALLRLATKDRRGLIICSDLSAMRLLAEEIIVFQEGHIAEKGKHGALLKRSSGVYRALWEDELKRSRKNRR